MRSQRLTLLLILFGLGLTIAALAPSDGDRNGLSTPSAWITGLLGVASLATGTTLLRNEYVAARAARGGGSMPLFLKVVLLFCGVTALAMAGYAWMEARAAAPRLSRPSAHGTKSKADSLADEQAEIRPRQGNDNPAAAPAPPAHAFQ